MDGVIDDILVEDGQQVTQGQPLVKMRSAMLEIQIQETLGEIEANSQKRDGLGVAINQLTRDGSTDYAMQSRLSSEVRELETQLETLEQKLTALRAQDNELLILSPIDGVIVTRQVEQTLKSRPVRRGDALMRVVRLTGPWQLELQVADQDSGYVKRKIFGAERGGDVPPGPPSEVEFVFASQPDQHRQARVTWLSESARNASGDGMHIDLLADVAPDVAARGHMGATVYAYFECGQQPFWFVWSRPFIETLQRKNWF
ncbi:MAG: HlyD family efflux transporter periplasmic adaptor subunit [Pirellulaceae bacterium]